MAKPHTQWVCQVCGRTSPRQMGRCPGCGEWNTMVEVVEERTTAIPVTARGEPRRLSEVEMEGVNRLPLRWTSSPGCWEGGWFPAPWSW